MNARKFLSYFIYLLVYVLSVQTAYADHLKGGWIKYSYIGKSGNSLQYKVSFYQYSDCSEPDKVDNEIYLSVYDASSQQQIGRPYKIALDSLKTQDKNNFGPCFQNQPYVCYLIAEYDETITVPANAAGYYLAVQRCCRIAGIENVPTSNNVGLTYTLSIPGGGASNDNSPVFDFNELVAICYNTPFTFDFSAKDEIDHDSLRYSLCSGLTGGSFNNPVVTNPPPQPYTTIPYISPYSGFQPLGPNVKIDPATGIVSGTAPSQLGTYVVAVCVDEFRNGVYIGHTRKELHLDVDNCSIGGALLDPSYITCDGLNFSFQNKATVNPDYSYKWDFGVTGITTDTSSQPNPSYNYADTGVYNVTLIANNNKGCEDTAKTEVKIFPGFNTDFSVDAKCLKYPYDFTDKTTTKYGVVNSWQWFFGESEEVDAATPNPSYTYLDTGLKQITLITTNSKGCVDTAIKLLDVTNGPSLALNFRDTLICSIDTLQLKSSSTTQGAVFSWAPSYNLINSSSNNPLIYPKQTTTYNVTVSYKGCVAQDSVIVNVIDHVNLALPADTIICKGDSIMLSPATNAIYFTWSPPASLNNAGIEYPLAAPSSNTNYSVRASVGKCFATDNMNVKVVPYPIADAGIGESICYGKTTVLNASIKAAYFTWSPTNSLLNTTTLSPTAGPDVSTNYILTVTDTLGCPKPVSDSVLVTVIPKILANAGNDTSVVRSQPLQLHATGATYYNWFPASGLSSANIANPVVTFTDEPDTVIYHVKVSTPEGCFGVDSIRIFIFNTQPEVFIPSAFTPNGDGRNDVFRPTVAGMKQFIYLRIYNRWGQLIYNSGRPDEGWDGTFKGNKQPAGTYVYTIQAVDYNNKPYFSKGTFVLIR